MSILKSKRKIIVLGCAAFLLTLIVGTVAFRGNNELRGAFTNGKSENCASFISIEFSGDRFVSTINVRLDSEAVTREHIADRIELSADGEYFIRITQHGNFYITDSGYAKNIAMVFPCGNVQYNQFSRLGNTITIARMHLTATV